MVGYRCCRGCCTRPIPVPRRGLEKKKLIFVRPSVTKYFHRFAAYTCYIPWITALKSSDSGALAKPKKKEKKDQE